MNILHAISSTFLLLFFTFSSLFAQVLSSPFVEENIDEIDIGYGLEIGDVDGDGRLDIILADQKQFVWYRNGDWKRFVMVDDLTERDNVCLAARDINQDGKVEVAVGAQWNPGETSDTAASGSVHYLIRPENPEDPWQAVKLHHEPTVHRMRWIRSGENDYQLIVLPLHGAGNQGGKGAGVKVYAYHAPDDPNTDWKTTLVDSSMHMTHNFAVDDQDYHSSSFLVAGKEGVKQYRFEGNQWHTQEMAHLKHAAGEISQGKLGNKPFITTIEPMHGTNLMLYSGNDYDKKTVLYDDLKEGHALAVADVLGMGKDQIIVGWREPNKKGKVGIKIFVPMDNTGESWMHYFIDDNGMACEDLKVADLDDDGDLDIIAAGRATKNLKIYWNSRGNKQQGQ
jgi:hypothetical protein